MDDGFLESHRSTSVFAEASRLRASLTGMASAALMTRLSPSRAVIRTPASRVMTWWRRGAGLEA